MLRHKAVKTIYPSNMINLPVKVTPLSDLELNSTENKTNNSLHVQCYDVDQKR